MRFSGYSHGGVLACRRPEWRMEKSVRDEPEWPTEDSGDGLYIVSGAFLFHDLT